MKISNHMIYALCGSILVATSIVFADPPKESLAGVWLVDYKNPAAGRIIKFGDYPSVPPGVQADLDAFNQSLVPVPVHVRGGWVAMSKDGRGIGFGKTSRHDGPHGVWIWPNWRNAVPIVFEDYNHFAFVSRTSRYAILYNGSSDEPVPTVIVDLQDPETFFPLPGVAKSTRYFHVTDEGRWAGVPAGRRKVLVGQFDPEQPNAGAEQAEEVELPVVGRVKFLTWVGSGDYLIVDILPDGEEEPKLFVIRGADLSVTDSADFAWLFAGGFMVGPNSTYGGKGEQPVLFTVSPDGQLSWQPTAFPKEAEEEGNERPAAFSPSGRFVLTYWDEVEWMDDDGEQAPVLNYRSDLRRTPLAAPDEPLPTYPTHEVDDEEIKPARYFWLSWE